MYLKRKLLWVIAFSLLGVGTFLSVDSYFADFEANQKRDTEIVQPFNGLHLLRQTFVANKNYLSRIELSLITLGNPSEDGFEVIVHLQDQMQRDIAVHRYAVPKTSKVFDINFSFAPQKNSRGKTYSILLETNAPPNTVAPLGSEYNAYPDGGVFLNDDPAEKDLMFFVYSRPPPTALILYTVEKSASRFADFLLISIIFFGLGYIISSAFLKPGDIIEQFVYSLGVGIAVPPILLYLLSLLGIELGKDNLLIIFMGLLMLVSTSRFLQKKKNSEKVIANTQAKEVILLSTFFVLATFTRMAQINDLTVPSGIDGPAHQKITSNIVQKKEIRIGALYHTGFHSNVFLVQSFSERLLPESTLVFGQWLSVVSGLSFYVLARKIFKDPLLALVSTVMYWFLAPFPATLIAWSRYPFLQGLVLLPMALSFFLDDLDFLKSNRIIIALILAGLLISHYGAFILFAAALYIFFRIGLIDQNNYQLNTETIFVAVIISLPFLMVLTIKAYYIFGQGSWGSIVQHGRAIVPIEDYKYLLLTTLTHGGWLIWLLGGSFFLIAMIRDTALLYVTGEWFLVIAIINWSQMTIMGHSASRPTNVLIFLSIPLVISSGFALKGFLGKNRSAYYLTILAIAFVGAYNISGIINPRNILFTSKDQKAMQWIENNTPPESIFLISSYFWDGVYKPEDGGGWIRYLTDRETIFPQTEEDYEGIYTFIAQRPIDYVYVGSGYGHLAVFIASDVDFDLVYNEKGILIYATRQ